MCAVGRWLKDWQNGQVEMFIETMEDADNRNNPEAKERHVTPVAWGTTYKPGEMYTIFKRYIREYHPDERDPGSLSLGQKLSKYTCDPKAGDEVIS